MTIILVNRKGMGEGPARLQSLLFFNYLNGLLQLTELPRAICFYGSGVLVFENNSSAISLLEVLSQRGVRLMICKTCISSYGLSKEIKEEFVGSMTEIIDLQMKADKVITI